MSHPNIVYIEHCCLSLEPIPEGQLLQAPAPDCALYVPADPDGQMVRTPMILDSMCEESISIHGIVKIPQTIMLLLDSR